MLVLLIALSVAVGVLWQQMQALRMRVAALELGGATEESVWAGSAAPDTMDLEPAVAPPASPPAAEPISRPAVIYPPEDVRASSDEIATPMTDEPADMIAPRPRAGFEDMFGRRLPIWAGGVTLAVAGFLIVKYSIDAGLLSPMVRVLMGLCFGVSLITAAEAALRNDAVVRDARVCQALAGAGIASIYGAILAAANLYHLVNPITALVGMALVTVLAGGLSVRFGAPSAVLGLVGGLAAPALIGSAQPDIPLLTLYLALAVGGLCALSRHQRWWWLAAAALIGGFGWGVLLIANGALDVAAALSIGVYTLALGVGLPLLLIGDEARIVRLGGSVAGCAQMAALVAIGGFAPLHWGLFGLISIAMMWLSRHEPLLAHVPLLGLGVAALLGLAWPGPSAIELAAMLAAMAAIYAAPAALRVWRDDVGAIDAPQVAGSALAIGLLPVVHFAPAASAMPALLGAALAAGVAALGWRTPSRRDDARFATLTIVAAALCAVAGMIGLAAWAIPPLVALLALLLHGLAERAEDDRIIPASWAFGLACIGVLMTTPVEMARLVGFGAIGDWRTLCRWAVPAGAATAIAYRSAPVVALVALPLAVLLGYGATAQVVPAEWLPIVLVLLLAGFALSGRASVLPGAATAALLSLSWATWPLATWSAASGEALVGHPLYVTVLPPVVETVTRLALPALAWMLVGLRLPLARAWRDGCLAGASMGAVIAAHILYKHVFAISDHAAFFARAMAERTLWEMILAGAALAAWQLRARPIAIGLGAASLAHFAWFTVLLHDPLWAAQAVGPWLVPAYATAFALAWASARALPAATRPAGWAMMVLTVLFAFSALRQLAHGSMPLWLGKSAGEDIARSVLAIALAVGFLRFGIARAARDWRIGSLALMLAAVVKVFLFDAAGLDGLARIASFAALGFSLIGVGWLYSRYLPDASR